MKKTVIIIAAVVILISSIAGAAAYITSTPEYAMKEIISDVMENGIDGLYPHLTGKAREAADALSSVADSGIFGAIIGMVSQSDYSDMLKSAMKEIKWSVDEILRDNSSVTAIISFDYKEKLSGAVELSMVKKEGEWKIDRVSLRSVD